MSLETALTILLKVLVQIFDLAAQPPVLKHLKEIITLNHWVLMDTKDILKGRGLCLTFMLFQTINP